MFTNDIQMWYINKLTQWGRDKMATIADDTFERIILNENVWTSIKISLKFVPKGSIKNIPSLVKIMAWRRSGDKPLFEPMMVRLPTQICVSRPQWVNIWYLYMAKANIRPLLSVRCGHFLYCSGLCYWLIPSSEKNHLLVSSTISWEDNPSYWNA